MTALTVARRGGGARAVRVAALALAALAVLAALATLAAAGVRAAGRALDRREATLRAESAWLRARLGAMDARLRELEMRADLSASPVTGAEPPERAPPGGPTRAPDAPHGSPAR